MTVEIRLTGPISISDGHHKLDEKRLAGRQGRLIFARLALERGPIHREVLADAIWPEGPPATWERTLSGLLSRIRTALAGAGLDELTIGGAFGNYELQAAPEARVDVHVASADAEAAVQDLAAGDLAVATDRAESAAATARRPFLAGEEGPWLDKARAELRATLVSALESLADARAGTPEAVAAAKEASELEPYRESAHVLLMRAHAALGNRADALRTYERCRELLTDELGVDPSAETQAVHLELLRDGSSTARGPATRDRLPRRVLPDDLPSGLVTFCLTDIEGSTQLFSKLGPRFLDLLEEHRCIIRQAVAAHGGAEVKTEGDGFLLAFNDAVAAVEAATRFQRDLAAHPWPKGHAVRVRVGLHAGEAEPIDNDYMSFAVHETARIGAAAHGGQTIVSDALVRHVEGRLPEGVTLRDLGEHELKDLGAMRLHQVCHADLPDEFPSLRSVGGPRGYVPASASSLVGRDSDLDELVALIRTSRLLTITGSGGVGKTRLAIEAARAELGRRTDGVWFVDLASVTDEAWLDDTVLHGLGVVRDTAVTSRSQVLAYLAGRDALIVLDNCEHLIDPCRGLIGEVIRLCPRVSVMATSRESLGLDGEAAWRARSLTPDESSRLFADRTRLVRPDFVLGESGRRAVARIVDRLDGIPLAIELAAARMRVLTAPQIAERLDDRFRLLTGGSRTSPPRQRTLEATTDWSYALLDDAEKHLLQHLSVFVGGFELEAAEAVSSSDALDLLDRLVDKSMVVTQLRGDTVRYRMLETIRQYCALKLDDAGDAQAARSNHLQYMTDAVRRLEPGLLDVRESETAELLTLEGDNIRAAIEWGLSSDPNTAAELAAHIWLYWSVVGRTAEAMHWLERVFSAETDGIDPETRARLQTGMAYLYGVDARPNDVVERHARAATDHARSRSERYWYDAWALMALAWCVDESVLADLDLMTEAAAWAEHARCDAAMGQTLATRAELLLTSKDEVEACFLAIDAAVDAARHSRAPSLMAQVLRQKAALMSETGGVVDALDVARDALTMAERGPNVYARVAALGTLAEIMVWLGMDDAEAPLLRWLEIARESGLDPLIGEAILKLGWSAMRRGELGLARTRIEEAIAVFDSLASPRRYMMIFSAGARHSLGEVSQLEGDLAAARAVFDASLEMAKLFELAMVTAFCLNSLGWLEQDAGDLDQAHAYHRDAIAVAPGETNPRWVRRSQAGSVRGLAGVALRRGDALTAVRLSGAADGYLEPNINSPEMIGIMHKRVIVAARNELGDAAFEAAFAQGRSAGLKATIAGLH